MSTRDDEPRVEADPLLGAVLGGRYRIEALIGVGGMGAVYRAEHVHMRKAVALKVLHREMSAFPEVVSRFEREAVAGGRIQHPHVVSASDFGKLDDGASYLVLEYLEGHSLAALLKASGKLAPRRALRIARQIAEALDAAHAAGIVHRDLKPDNVMLVIKDGERDYVKVLDFGIAKITAEEGTPQPALTRLGTVFGTPEYMSPEQARGELVDARADLYTVGVILFEMLSGTSPFRDDDMVVVLTRHLTADPPPLPAELDPAVAALVSSLLQKKPDQRVQSARALLDRIDEISNSSMPAAGSAQASGPVPNSMERVAGPTASARSVDSAVASRAPKSIRRASPFRPIAIALSALSALVALVALVALAGRVFRHRAAHAGSGTLAEIAAKDPDLARVLDRAQLGDASALAEIAARPEADRTLAEWQALGRGYAKASQFGASLSVYRSGVIAHAELARDPRLLADVRLAAFDAQTSDAALGFAARSLGASGADLLYEIWESAKTLESRAAVAKLARTHLDEEAVRAQASPALKVLLDLGKAQKEGCGTVKRWLARAAAQGDERLVPSLKRFDDRRGCGFLGLADCYGCLRAGKDVALTRDSVAARRAPNFD